ncbi:uracil phosphoribosyltransferase-domain-containing protein [Apiospora kogelbergensis]|uniref:uracil phosphoribosyltransferase n=1 Tax=Apiospora kogelbergensis TaxID=1337665 RepID=A0AAW0R3E4_9PEZI
MSLPSNVHVSRHPCLLGKLSLLRSKSTSAREVKALINEIATIVGVEALASALTPVDGPKDETPIGFEYTTTTIEPEALSIVPILRSGLGMVEAIQTLLPNPIPVHHLGLYREPSTLEPVEYYNNLPQHVSSGASDEPVASLAIILDPVIATGGTCAAAIQTLREWGVKRILVLSVVAAAEGIKRAAAEWPDAVEIWVAGVDEELTGHGMLKPGVGDVGDRLFLTIGK